MRKKDKKLSGLVVVIIIAFALVSGYYVFTGWQFASTSQKNAEESAQRTGGTSNISMDIEFNEGSTVYRCSSYYIEKQQFSVVDFGNTVYDLKGNYLANCGGFKSYSSQEERQADAVRCAQYPLTDRCTLVQE